jgi:hypothetical protein
LSDELPADLSEVVDFFGLPNAAVVEKDWRVVQALAAIAALDTAPVRLIFGGGTALSRAHRLIRRMSEDIDLKIVAEPEPNRGSLRRLREAVTSALLEAGFEFDPANPQHRESGNTSRWTIFRIPYRPRSTAQSLRPEILIEMGVWPLRRPAVELPVLSFVAEAMKRPPEVARMACVSITQTAAEKFVALTRRVAAELEPGAPQDPTLVRHLYDLHALRAHYDPAEVAMLARQVMPHDAVEFGNKAPAYREDPLRETQRALKALGSLSRYADAYYAFRQTMVYGEAVEYAACLATLNELAKRLS